MNLPPRLLGTLIKNGRLDKHLTQENLAELAEISLPYLKDIERHKSIPSLSVFYRLMRVLNLSADSYLYSERNLNDTTYRKLQRLLTECTESDLAVLLATAEALLKTHNPK